MADRNDITYIQTLSPRVAEIAAPSTEIVMQDYVDTTRNEEERFRSMGFPKLVNASGKEDLGGGVFVAVTVQEQNLQLAFQPRFTPTLTGTVTTASGPPNLIGRVTFTDTAQDFVTDGVKAGSYMINWTKQSVTDVVRVVDSDTLETRAPQNGSDDEWDIGDSYSLWNIVQVRTSGGNLVAVDENGSPIPAILPTWGTQVILTTSSSATIQELLDIQFASFNGGVTVNLAGSNPNAVSGTVFPAGTPRAPCNNMTDALSIATDRGFTQFYVQDDLTIPIGPTFDNFGWVGESAARTTITVPAAATVNDCEYFNATVTGTLDGNSSIRQCSVGTLDFVNGRIIECAVQAATITLGGGLLAEFVDCWDEGAGFTHPTIDMGGSGQDLNVVRWTGGLNITNKTGAMDAAVIDLTSGDVTLDASVTSGTVVVRGIGTLTDNSVGAAVTNGLQNSTNTAASVWNALLTDHLDSGTFGEFIARRLLTVAKFFALRK